MLKTYFILYKPFLIFLASFFLTYIILTFLYQNYLNSFETNRVDTITAIVSKNVESVLQLFDSSALVQESANKPYYKIIYNNKYLARIIEGCNAMSVIILFISFVVAFAGKLVPTLLYILGGSVIIYVLNVMRIAALSVLIFYFPQYLSLLHGVLFPLYIYGVVFILWLIWVRKFSRYAAKDIK